jgi:hypothetical protein
MQRILALVCLFIFGFLWLLGCSDSCRVFLYDTKIAQDEFRYGDLYRLSFLSQFKDKDGKKCKCNFSPKKQKRSLTVLGDSFTEEGRVIAQMFDYEDYRWQYMNVKNPFPQVLPSKKNILILAPAERLFRKNFDAPHSTNFFLNGSETSNNSSKLSWNKLMELEMPYKEDKHQAVLFGSDFIMKIKEWKAALNLKLFNRPSQKVFLSPDQKQIFLKQDIEPGWTNSEETLADSTIDRYVKNVNASYSFYKSKGYDEVYLSIIPNKSTAFMGNRPAYNHLLERIENHKDLKMPVISTIKGIKAQPKATFLKGDTHWSCEGIKIWLDKVNAL